MVAAVREQRPKEVLKIIYTRNLLWHINHVNKTARRRQRFEFSGIFIFPPFVYSKFPIPHHRVSANSLFFRPQLLCSSSYRLKVRVYQWTE